MQSFRANGLGNLDASSMIKLAWTCADMIGPEWRWGPPIDTMPHAWWSKMIQDYPRCVRVKNPKILCPYKIRSLPNNFQGQELCCSGLRPSTPSRWIIERRQQKFRMWFRRTLEMIIIISLWVYSFRLWSIVICSPWSVVIYSPGPLACMSKHLDLALEFDIPIKRFQKGKFNAKMLNPFVTHTVDSPPNLYVCGDPIVQWCYCSPWSYKWDAASIHFTRMT